MLLESYSLENRPKVTLSGAEVPLVVQTPTIERPTLEGGVTNFARVFWALLPGVLDGGKRGFTARRGVGRKRPKLKWNNTFFPKKVDLGGRIHQHLRIG
jgi:hypothetical protein